MPERYDVWAMEPVEIKPGYFGRAITSEHTTHMYWEIEADRPLPEHAHPHEQIVNMIEGTYELVIGGESYVLNAGDVLVIPGGVPHGGRLHTACKILDVFSPVREEYR